MTYPHMQTIRSDIATSPSTRRHLHARSLEAQAGHGDPADLTGGAASPASWAGDAAEGLVMPPPWAVPRRLAHADPLAKRGVPELRMVVVARGPHRAGQPATHDGVEIPAFVFQLCPAAGRLVTWPRPTVPPGLEPHRRTCVRAYLGTRHPPPILCRRRFLGPCAECLSLCIQAVESRGG
jgi:hypothetical protein